MKIRHHLAVFGFFFFAYMLGASREIPWNDARLLFNTAESIVFRGSIGIPAGPPGAVYYAPQPLLPSLALVPGVMVYKWVVERWLEAWSMAKVITCHLGSSFFGALTCVLFLNACLRLGVSRRKASLCTLLLGFGTFVWVYSRSPYSEIIQAAAVMGYVGALISFWDRQDYRTALRVGLWGALMINSKLVFVLALPGGMILCFYRLRHEWKRFLKLSLIAFIPLGLGILVILKHNEARTGIATGTGYGGVAPEIFAQPLWEGVWGLLLSPGRSVFLFSPPLVLAFLGLSKTWKTKPHVLWMLGLCFPPAFFLYAKYEAWSGDWGWGPRYLVPFVAPFMLPAAVFLQSLGTKIVQWRWATAIAAFSVAGLFVQSLGNAFYWDHYIRISQEARNSWLGNPNRVGSKGVPRPNACDPCFEDFYPFQWLPAFQQIEGHWWLLKSVPLKKSWIDATMTAPWTRYTTMVVPIDRSYRQARVDWWVLQFWKRFKPASFILLAILILGSCASGFAWAWSCRRRT